MTDFLHSMHFMLALAGMVSIVCRLKTMSKRTRAVVRWQHGILFAGLLWSVLLPIALHIVLPDDFTEPPREYAALPLLIGVVAFLLMSADRWRHGPPEGTTKPTPLDPLELHHVSGGKG